MRISRLTLGVPRPNPTPPSRPQAHCSLPGGPWSQQRLWLLSRRKPASPQIATLPAVRGCPPMPPESGSCQASELFLV